MAGVPNQYLPAMKRKLHLLIIDPQNDFCDLPTSYCPLPVAGLPCAPALPVPGAHEDMRRVARIIERAGHGISGITVTLDSHHRLDIAHPAFWMDRSGAAVAAFTEITADQVADGVYLPREPKALPRVLSYLHALEAAGRYKLMVWPTHCEIGSWGHNVHADVRAAYNRWEERSLTSVDKVVKGSNPWTEHYSAIAAEVSDPDDAGTQTNHALIASLKQGDSVFIAGEAGSHCVRATCEHLVEHWNPAQLSRLVLITDCISPVSGFERHYLEFLSAMQARGLRLAQSDAVLAELLDNAQT